MWIVLVSILAATLTAVTFANRGWDQVPQLWRHIDGLLFPPAPPFTLSGQIEVMGAPDISRGVLTVKVFWIKPGVEPDTDPSYVFDFLIQSPEFSLTDEENGNLTYELRLNDRPPDAAIEYRYSSTENLGYDVARGFVVAFVDLGKDGIFNRGADRIVSVSDSRMVLWRRPDSPSGQLSREGEVYRFLHSMHKGYCLAESDTTAGGPFECINNTITGGDVHFAVGDKELEHFEHLRKADLEHHQVVPPAGSQENKPHPYERSSPQ